MSSKFHLKFYSVFSLMAILLLSLVVVPQVFAHGGEDHGDEKPQATQSTANMTVRVVRSGDYEVTLKHPSLVPDKELAARLFITRYDTNEPLKDAKVVLLATNSNGMPVEVSASATDTPGLYEIKLPPLPQGDYKLSARVDVSGSSMTANFGDVQVRMPEVETPAADASWARTALIALGVISMLALLGAVVVFIALKQSRRNTIEEEAVTA